jgi:outer membrane protein insertion porin family
MSHWKSILLIVVLCTATYAHAQDSNVIASIKIEGNKRIATETYLYYISSKPGSTYNREALVNDFKRLWGTGFLSDLKIETDETPEGVVVTFVVEEKPLIKAIEYTGNKKISNEDIQTKLKDDNITIRIDQPFDPYAAKKVTNAIDKLLLEKGLQFGSTSFKTEPMGDSFAKLIFVVDEGPKVKIGEIQFEGNKVFTDSKLRKQMKDTKEHWMFSFITRKDDFEKEKFDKDMEKVQELYFNNGYINARIDEPKIEQYDSKGMFGESKRMRIVIPVEEGSQFRTGDITFTGNTVFDSATLQRSFKDLEKGEVFNRGMLRTGIEAAQGMYGDQGYIYASLGPAFDVDEPNKVVNLKIQVEENGQFYVNRMEFTGNNYTRDKVIRREMLLQEGDLLRVSRFRESLDRIYRLGYFDDLKPNITPVSDEEAKADISLDVKENKRNEIRLGGGYSELEGFFGNVVFSTKNLFGTGKVFSINVQGGSRTEIYQIDVLEPYFLDRRLTIGAGVFKTRYDYVTFLRDTTGASLTFGFPIYEEFKGLLSYSYQIIDIGNVNPGQPVNDDLFPGINDYQQDRAESRLTPSLVRSTINNPNDPSRGTRLILANQFVGGFLGGDLDYFKPSAAFTFYFPGWLGRNYWGFNVESGFGAGYGNKPFPFYERYFLGGERSIRGYDQRTVGPIIQDPVTSLWFNAGGNKFFVANAEYVVPLAGPIKVAGFVDYGNAFAEGDGINFVDMHGSFGAELRFVVPFLSAPFRFIYAINFKRGDLMKVIPPPEHSVFRFSVGTTF